MRKGRDTEKETKKKMMEIAATNVIASRPPNGCNADRSCQYLVIKQSQLALSLATLSPKLFSVSLPNLYPELCGVTG